MEDIQRLTQEQFPPLLREIPDAPETLYIRGVIPPKNHKLLTVVGSRRMSAYGKDAVGHIIRGLAGAPISIVSGLALGIDGAAHKAALSSGLHTVAIPGSGISDQALYPRAHFQLAQDILTSGGALMSEEEPDFRARPESFPKRNRIMAGMSHAVLVIEATMRSGTLITSRLAVDYNRDVLTVPGSLFSEGTEGPHMLLKLGATPVRSGEDVLEALGIESSVTGESASLSLLSQEEQHVLDALSSPLPRDELIRTLGLAIASANALLLGMELKGLIKETLGMVQKS